MRAAVVVVGILLALSAHATAQAREPGAYVFVLDRSSSMRGDKLALVKSSVLDAIDGLQPDDQVAVVAFAGTARTVVPLQAAKRRPIEKLLAGVGTAAGDDLAAGIDAAVVILSPLGNRTRHIVVITDGSSTTKLGPTLARVERAKLSMSAIAVQSEMQPLLTMLSEAGHGHDFKVDQLEMLPLTITKALQVPISYDLNAVVVILDRSGSMSGPKLETAKESVRVLNEVLAPRDQMGLVTFDSEAEIAIPLRDAGKPMRLKSELARVEPGGGTNIFVGLKLGFDMLKNVQNKNKFVILLTDGESPSDGIVELVQEMHRQKISVTCVGLQGADRTLLSQIADAGEGRLYMVEDLGALPKIFMKESER